MIQNSRDLKNQANFGDPNFVQFGQQITATYDICLLRPVLLKFGQLYAVPLRPELRPPVDRRSVLFQLTWKRWKYGGPQRDIRMMAATHWPYSPAGFFLWGNAE